MSVFDTVKEAANLAKEHGRMDLYEKLLDYRAESVDLREQNLTLKQQILELNNHRELDNSIVFHDGVHWITNDEKTQGNVPTPICPRCWDVDKVVVRQKLGRYGSSGSSFTCKNCAKFFCDIHSFPKT
ncbi:MAG: hypothetical protein IIA17_07725 [candidate division Zixibacteria bacterium]|nr:hypothetical protein [candidate division Zixibacteria bacterium]